MKTINEIYGTDSIALANRKRVAEQHPELLLYLMTVTRIDRTGSVTGGEPLGHLILASYLQMVGWNVRVFAGSIYDALKLMEKDRIENEGHLVLVGLYCDYENKNAVSALAAKIKERLGYPVLVGGPQSVALGEEFVRTNPSVDAVIRGDGEYSLSDVLSAYACGFPKARFSIRGVCGMDGDICIDNGFSEILTDMDEAPPVRDTALIGRSNKRKALGALSGRGCPFHCAFCYEGGNSKTVRLRSVEHMINEIRVRFRDHPEAKFLYFGDDTFTLMPDRLAAFCDALKALRKEHDFVWYADGHVRVLLKHPEYLPMMIDAGLCRLQIGIESTVQSVIDVYQKNIKKEELYKTVDLCLEAGLPQLIGNIIIGGALETRETIRETFETIYDLLARSQGMLDVTSTFYSHFPGTMMSADPERFGLKLIDPEGFTSFGDLAITDTTGLTRNEITALRREFIVESSRVMKRCVEEGLVDEERMLKNMYLSRHYGLSSLWMSFGLSRQNRHYYEKKCDFGTEFDKAPDPKCLIPERTVFFHNAESYVKTPPSVSGMILSPLEDELLHWSAGKLTLGQIRDRLWPKWKDSYKSREEFEDFTDGIMKRLERKRLLIFAGLDGSQVAREIRRGVNHIGRARQMEEGDEETVRLTSVSQKWQAEERTLIEERTQTGGMEVQESKGKPGVENNRVILFYPYTISSITDKSYTGRTQGIFILGAVLKQEGYDAKVCECVFNRIPDRIRQMNDGSIRAVGMSMDYENRRHVLALSRYVTENFGIPVIIGGVDARTITCEELAESRAAVVIKGEGELTLPKVMEGLGDEKALEGISGLLLLRDGALMDTGPEEPPLDLDALPFADYSLSMEPITGDSATVITSRGCPNHCAFCHEGTHKTRMRMRSIPHVMAEVRSLLARYPNLSYVCFCDDTLVANVDRVKELCAGMKELRRTYSVEWYCEADVYSLSRHPEIIPMMVDAGMIRMQIGIESGDDNMLALYEKPLKTDMVRRVVKAAYDAGLPSLVGPLLIGAPFENRDHIELEIRWAKELLEMAPGMIEVPGSIISPYPQTRIGRDPGRYGYTFTDARGDGSNTDYPGYYTRAMTEKEILAGYQDLTRTVALTCRAMLEEGRIPYERLKRIVSIYLKRGTGVWGNIMKTVCPFIFSYFQLMISCDIPPIREIDRGELEDWHIQRTFEIWRFVDFSGYAPRIGKYVLSPYEYQLILYCAGKLSVREITELMYERFSGGDTPGAFRDRIMDTLLAFEKKYWVVGVPF